MKKKIIFILLLFTLFGACTSSPTQNSMDGSPCIQNRAAIDIGSSSTKLKIAQVNTCSKKILKTLEDTAIKIDYKQDLSENKNHSFSVGIMEKGLNALLSFKKLINQHQIESKNIVTGATAAFREAKNKNLYIKKIFDKTEIKVIVLSQKQEAFLGFYAALSQSDLNPSELIVWDIGGGSMQMTTQNNLGELDVLEGKLASVSFKNKVIREVKKNKTATTPNPLHAEEIEKSILLAKENALATVPQSIIHKIHQQKGAVVGIGGVHGISLKNQLKKSNYSLEDILSALKFKSNLTDQDIGGDYAQTEVTNLILVAGFMKELGIKTVNAMNIQISDGLLLGF